MAISFASGIITVTGNRDNGTASSGAAKVLNDTSKSWTTDQFKNSVIKITGGTGIGQYRRIWSNTSTQLSMIFDWETTPDNTSSYEIYYNPRDLFNDTFNSPSGNSGTYIDKLDDLGGNRTQNYEVYKLKSERIILSTSARFSISNQRFILDRGCSSAKSYDTFIVRNACELFLGDEIYVFEKTSYADSFSSLEVYATDNSNQLGGGVGVDSGGSLVQYGGFLMTCDRLSIDGGATLVLRDATWNNFSNLSDRSKFLFLAGTGNNYDIQGLSLSAKTENAGSLFRNNPAILNGYAPKNVALPFGVSSSAVVNLTASKYVVDRTNSCDFAAWSGSTLNQITFLNPLNVDEIVFTYLGTIETQFSGNSSNKGSGFVKFTFNPKVKDSSGTLDLQNAVVYLKDTDNGSRVSPYTTDYIYTLQTDTQGEVSQDVMTLVYHRPVNIGGETPYDYRTPYNGQIRKYGYKEAFLSNFNPKEPFVSEIRMTDNIYTLSNEATVASYTGIAIDGGAKTITLTASHTIEELYEYSEYWAALFANAANPIPMSTADGLNYIFVFDWNLILGSGGIITGANNKSIAFSGTGELVLQSTSNNIDNVTINGNVSIDAAIGTIDGVIVTGTTDYTVAGSYDIDNSTLNIVTAPVAVTLNIDENTTITDSSDPDVTVVAPTGQIDFTGLIAGSQIVVCSTGTQTEAYRNNSTGTSESTGAINSGTYDYTIRKTDYFEIRGTGVVIGTSPVPIQAQQEFDRAYAASSGLTFGTTATINTTTKEFAVTVATTVQNWYSFCKEAFIAESSLVNVAMPLRTFGSTAFILIDDYEFTSASLQYLSRDGFSYEDTGGVTTARWCAVLSQGVTPGLQVEYQQVLAAAPTDAQNTGDIDQVIQFYGDATHGNFDYSGYLKLKVQASGYREARVDIIADFQLTVLEETLYSVPLFTVAIDGLTLGDPVATGITITKEATPVSRDVGNGAKDYSGTILDTGTNSGDTILREFNWNLAQDAIYQTFEPFDLPEMVVKNGNDYETARGVIENDGTPEFHGWFVTRDGTNPHPDFTRFQADDGTYGVVPTTIQFQAPNVLDGSAYVFWINGSVFDSGTVSGGSGYSISLVEGTDYTDGQSYLFITTYQSAGTAKLPLRNAGVLGTSNVIFNDSQVDWSFHNTAGVDGSTVTECATDYVQIQVEVNDPDNNSTKKRLAAFIVDAIGTVDGILNWVDVNGNPAINYISSGSALIDKSVVDLEIVNVKAGTSLNFVDDFQLRASDGTSLVDTSTNGINWDNGSEAVIVPVGSGLSTAQNDRLFECSKEATLLTLRSASGTGVNITEVTDTPVTDVTDFHSTGLDEAALHTGLDNYANKDDYKADALDQATFDNRMSNVPGATKDTYKADVSSKADASELATVKANQDIINTNVKKGSAYAIIGGPDTA